jgi:hypothetical protein
MSERDRPIFLFVGFLKKDGRPDTVLKLVNVETAFKNLI